MCKGLARELTWVGLEVGVHEPLVVSVDGPGHARPGLGEAQSSGNIAALHDVSLQTQETQHEGIGRSDREAED